MSRRLRRLPLLLVPALLATTLVACGSDEGSSGTDSSGSKEGLHGIVITGDIGAEPKVEWNGELETDETETTVVTEGDGDEIADGDQVQANLWVGNGTTQEPSYSTYDEGGTAETITASADLAPVFKDAVLGQRLGSRVAVTTTAEEAFGEAGNPNMQIGNKDTVLIIVDLMEMYEPPTPKDVPSSEMPSVVEEKGKPVGLDFAGIAEPKADDDLKRTVLEEGDGEELTTDMTVKVNYLGSVYQGKKPFDESYSKEPVEFALTGVVQGWTYGLEGVKVGSRVLLAIPPALGYGDQEQSGIPAGSTLYFVVDVISAK